MKVIIAGGGTGGHIYPAISIAQSLQEIKPEIEILFVGTARGLEKKIIPKAGYKLALIQSGQINLQGQIFKKLISLIKIPLGIIQSFFIIITEKPDFVLGVGGYASAPMMIAAGLISKFSSIETAVWEPNAHPGMANRIISNLVNRTYLVFETAKQYLKSKNNLTLGMPLRKEIENAATEIKSGDSKNQIFTILCFGGSQGSFYLNETLSDLILKYPTEFSNIKIIHQTGPKDFERIKLKYKDLKQVEVHEYIFDMPTYYKQAHLLYCRGGASSLAEAAVYGLVPIVIPLAAADNHQQKNAEALVEKNAGFMILQSEFDQEKFKNLIFQLKNSEAELNKISLNLKQMVQVGAANRIAKDIINTLKIIKS